MCVCVRVCVCVCAGAALQRDLASAQSELRRARTDLELAHATAARLNARVTELAAAEAAAREQARAADAALTAEQELHARELAVVQSQSQSRTTHSSSHQPLDTARRPVGTLGHHPHTLAVPPAANEGRAVEGSVLPVGSMDALVSPRGLVRQGAGAKGTTEREKQLQQVRGCACLYMTALLLSSGAVSASRPGAKSCNAGR